MLRNMLGPISNFNLDQFVALEFAIFCFFWGGGAETPMFVVFSAKMQIFKRNTEKGKKTLFVNIPVLTLLVKMSVCFLYFSFLLFFEFPCFWEIFLIGSQKSTNKKISKQRKQKQQQQQQQQRNTMQSQTNLRLWFKIKQDNKQKSKNKRTSWDKKQEPEIDMRNNNQGRKKRTR